MSKQAYNTGVVIITCSGCKNKHLIADHLGWYDSQKSAGTIEDIMREKGEGVERLNPDSEEAFELVASYNEQNKA
jgi:protein import protein ZIM17